jgi:hypothetical protein
VIRFLPAVPGIFEFYCSKRLLFFESHKDKGMRGVIEVVPRLATAAPVRATKRCGLRKRIDLRILASWERPK